MAARRWSIINYNAFLRELKRVGKVSHLQAQQGYRQIRARVDRPLRAVDIDKHPVIVKQEMRSILHIIPITRGVYIREELAGIPRAGQAMRESDWNELYDVADAYDDISDEVSGSYTGD